jgi:hypothetical protein
MSEDSLHMVWQGLGKANQSCRSTGCILHNFGGSQLHPCMMVNQSAANTLQELHAWQTDVHVYRRIRYTLDVFDRF